MAIKGNLSVELLRNKINAEIADAGFSAVYFDLVIINPDEEPHTKVMLAEHAMDVRENVKIAKGELFCSTIPAAAGCALLDEEKRLEYT